VFALLSMPGCGASESVRLGIVIRDSAGVRIVENGDAGAACHLAAEPMLELGVLEGAPEYQLHGVVHAIRLPDGEVAIANAGSREVRLYDQNGRFLRAFGREGDGPGEFRIPVRLWQR